MSEIAGLFGASAHLESTGLQARNTAAPFNLNADFGKGSPCERR